MAELMEGVMGTFARSFTGLLAILALADVRAAFIASPALNKTCPDGAIISVSETCRPLSGSAQPGVSESTFGAVGNALAGAIGGIAPAGVPGGGIAGSGFGSLRVALDGGKESGKAAAAGAARWNVWGAVSRVESGYSFQPLQSGGHTDIILAGMDYNFGDVVAGVAVSGERSRIGTTFNGGNISGDGNTVAPYLAWRINRNWSLDASLGFGTTRLATVDNAAGGATGSNRATRSMGTLGVSYGQAVGAWVLSARGGLLAFDNRYSSMTFSNGTFVDAVGARTTQMRLGVQAAYNAGGVVPYAGLTYVYDVQRPTQGVTAGQTAANDRDTWQLRVGLNFRGTRSLYGGVSLSSDLGRSQVRNDQFLLNIGLRF